MKPFIRTHSSSEPQITSEQIIQTHLLVPSGVLQRAARILACSLSLLLWWPSSTPAQQIWEGEQFHQDGSLRESQPLVVSEVLQDLSEAGIVYLGESHDNPADHTAQLDIIQRLHQANPRLAIALEMFQQPFQAVIDQYLAGKIDEAELRERTEYDERWGLPWEYYAPFLRYAREHDLPVLALNVPTEVTRQVAEKGLDSLSARDRQYIPPVDEIDTDQPAYRQFMLDIYKDFHDGHGASTSFDRFFLSQVLWDETMAAGIVEFLEEHPDHQVVVLAGQGHIVYGYGIPSRVARRLNEQPDRFPDWTQQLVLLNPAEDLAEGGEGAIADYLWFTEASASESSLELPDSQSR